MTSTVSSLSSDTNIPIEKIKLKVSGGVKLNWNVNEEMKSILKKEFKDNGCLDYWSSRWEARKIHYTKIIAECSSIKGNGVFHTMIESWNA